jgi:hypothetical protein
MAPKPRERPTEPDEPPEDTQDGQPRGALVPTYGVSAIVPGTQAFRRDNVIFYTVRGEPRKVLELMGMLDRQGVNEVVALISHQVDGGLEEEEEPRAEDEPDGSQG